MSSIFRASLIFLNGFGYISLNSLPSVIRPTFACKFVEFYQLLSYLIKALHNSVSNLGTYIHGIEIDLNPCWRVGENFYFSNLTVIFTYLVMYRKDECGVIWCEMTMQEIEAAHLKF